MSSSSTVFDVVPGEAWQGGIIGLKTRSSFFVCVCLRHHLISLKSLSVDCTARSSASPALRSAAADGASLHGLVLRTHGRGLDVGVLRRLPDAPVFGHLPRKNRGRAVGRQFPGSFWEVC